MLLIRIQDPVPFDTLIRDVMNNPDHVPESLETFSWVELLKFFDADPIRKKIRIWERKNSDPGCLSRIRNTGLHEGLRTTN